MFGSSLIILKFETASLNNSDEYTFLAVRLDWLSEWLSEEIINRSLFAQ